MRFPDEFLNELKSRVRLSDVIGRKVKLQKRGKDYVGLSPFSNEKTPSFYVHDDRGFYKCFSTQKSGDAITFLMETERLSFAEAVEKLASDVGLDLPKQSAEEQQVYKQQVTLRDWVERACQFFEAQLLRPVGAEARQYLEKRGFGEASWRRHRIGFAPDGWRNLFDELVKQGATAEQLVEAGLVVQADDDAAKRWDRFRNRVIFPISDPAGKVIAFGARTLDPNGKPKYLNSSDSPLFHKGKTLYRFGPAREALNQVKDGPLSRGLIVTEGYVDAIALAEAGIGTAVAPLGTALTEDQIQLLWRAGPEPILCFDGDAAGLNAAWRAIDRALPLIEPGRSLWFVLLPDGMDPDDMVRLKGATATREALEDARPLVDLLWKRELDAEPVDTPERRAGLQARLDAAAAKIAHPAVRKAYERELRERLYDHFRPARQSQPAGQGRPWQPGQPGQGFPKRKVDARQGISPGATKRTGLGLLVHAIVTPGLAERSREALIHANFADPDVEAIRDAVFNVLDGGESLDRRAVAAHLRNLGRDRSEKLLEEYPVTGALDLSSMEGREWFLALERFPAAAAVSEEARAVIREVESDGATERAPTLARLKAVIAEREQARRPQSGQETEAAEKGASELWNAVDDLDGEIKRRFPDG
jgi:DNA primase